MHKVLLVDDEKLVLKSLEDGVDWKKSGFCVAGKAGNGETALQMVKDLKPQVVFTDIRMPGISGLELIKQIKELDRDIQIVVISGYAEFAYVQKSLYYGVLGYCLKPFDDHEIDKLLGSAAGMLDDARKKRESRLLEWLEETSPDPSPADFDQLLADSGLTADTLHVAVSLGKGRIRFRADALAIGIPIGSACSGYIVQYPDRNERPNGVALPFPDDVQGVGIVRSDRSRSSLMEALQKATLLAWNSFIHERRDVYREEEDAHDGMADRLVRRLEQAVAKRDPVLLRDLLDESLHPDNRRRLNILHALKIYNIVYFHSSSDRANAHEEDYIFSKEQLFHLYRGFDSMIASLKDFLRGMAHPGTLLTEYRTAHASLNEIVKYINDNFRSDISIQSLSKGFYMNPNYLSQLFKREMKFTFTEYLTKVRLLEAKKLLRSTELSIAEIAEQSGFRDYFYFTKTFKKHTQQTPRQYRMKDNQGARKHPGLPAKEE